MQETKIAGVIDKKSKPPRLLEFTDIPPTTAGRHARQNVVENTPGVLPQFQVLKSHAECLGAMLSDDIITWLCNNANHRFISNLHNILIKINGKLRYYFSQLLN